MLKNVPRVLNHDQPEAIVEHTAPIFGLNDCSFSVHNSIVSARHAAL
jgi:hypothetical protein